LHQERKILNRLIDNKEQAINRPPLFKEEKFDYWK